MVVEEEPKEQKPETPDYLDQLKRVQADFENYVKRVSKEREHIELLAKEKVFSQILTIIDDFHRAVHNASNASKEELAQGVVMIAKQLDKFLEHNSIKCIDCKGKPFDPYRQEVILQVDSEMPEGTVVDILQSGYTIGEHVLRYAKVSVSKGGKQNENNRN
ncbi:nucleotide exchange factor GrpE [Candidatus Woesearchaeota archaeon]|nr:nucleotide exchange factor GrpE [Candidatus Woesearchaeota archaeon]